MKPIVRHILTVLCLVATLFTNAQINTEQVLRVGQNALYFEDYVLSIQYFNQVIQAKPYLAQPYLFRAIAKFNLDDFAGAEADASKALEMNPYLPDAWEVRGVARQNLGNDSAAICDYDHALELLPRNKTIMFNKAMAQSEIKDYENAEKTLSDVLEFYPGYDNAYIGRAKLKLAQNDTIAAVADIEKALDINSKLFTGYLMRAAISIDQHSDYKQALADMDKAIKLEPRIAGLYINRAFLRYSLDDYFGAMADYDYSLELDPINQAAMFNRSLLLMEVGDYERAISDLTKILKLNPEEHRARYNRAVAYGNRQEYDKAIADLTEVMNAVPELSSAYFLRSEYYRLSGNLAKAETDYKKGMAVAKTSPTEGDVAETDTKVTPEEAARRFNALITIENETPVSEEYNNTAIRGRVQDRDLAIEIAPLIELSYYSSPTELGDNSYYIKEVDDINSTRLLRFLMMVVSNPPSLNDESLIKRHFESIDYYNSYIATHPHRAIDFLGRAMDFVTLRNYEAAIQDIDRALELTPDQPIALLLRAQARYHQPNGEFGGANVASQKTLALADLDRVVELSPRMAPAWFNKGNLHYELGDYTSAIAAYNRAIELAPTMGEAYYNRGYVHLKLGNQQAGIDDLSKAGELGIVSAYNLIKRLGK